MTKALIDRIKIGCFGLDPIDPLRLLLDEVIEALAQQEQEPVGQLLEDAFGRGQVMWFNKPKDESMLYITPQSEKYPQIAINPEIVGYVAPQRTWVGLTNGEMIELSEMKLGSWDLILEVEDKLKDKNMKSEQIKHSLSVGIKSIQSRVFDRETDEVISFVKIPIKDSGLVRCEWIELTDQEINLLAKAYSTMEGELNAPAFAIAILRKAQNK